MKYKYNKRQIFGKKLKIPKDILNKVYSCTLSFNEFIEYDLEDKIPISCITYNDRKVVEKFGIDKCKKLDWELLSPVNGSYNISKDILMSFDTQTENINANLYELVKNQIRPVDYSSQMKRIYSNRLFDITQEMDEDLTEGTVELIDTGSTGRGTNKPGDGDFDFMMRIDKSILSNPSKLIILKQTILRNLGIENASLTSDGDFRLKNVQIDNDTSVDIDITFTQKTDNIAYSTDMALQDRLNTIYNLDPEKYKYVIANILLAKQVLKNAQAYKPDRGETPQGGLGGVGIEN